MAEVSAPPPFDPTQPFSTDAPTPEPASSTPPPFDPSKPFAAGDSGGAITPAPKPAGPRGFVQSLVDFANSETPTSQPEKDLMAFANSPTDYYTGEIPRAFAGAVAGAQNWPTKLLKAGAGSLASTVQGSEDIADALKDPSKAAAVNQYVEQYHHLPNDMMSAVSLGATPVNPAGAAEKIAPEMVAKYPEAQQRLQDFQQSGITPTLPAVTQNRTLGNIANVTKEVPLLGEPISTMAQTQVGQAEQRSKDIADTFGDAANPKAGGEALKQGYQQFKYGPTGGPNAPTPDLAAAVSSPTKAIGFVPKSDALYGAIPISSDAPAKLDNTIATLKSLTSQFPSNPELGKTLQNPVFQKWADSLENSDGLTWDEMKNLRSYVGQQTRQPMGALGVGPDEWRGLYGALSNDMKDTAVDQGPAALNAFNRANNYYSAGLARLNDAMGFINKATSDEGAFNTLLAKGSDRGKSADIARFQATMKSLPDEFKGDVASTMINRMGQPVASAASPDNPFSIGTWATNYNALSPSAKDAVFGAAGTSQRDDLESLSRSISALKGVDKLGNPSGSGRFGVVGATAAATAGALTNPVPTVLGLAGTYGGAKLLTSPGMARWIANSTKVATPAGWTNQMARLKTLAAKNPGIVGPYAQALQDQQGGQ